MALRDPLPVPRCPDWTGMIDLPVGMRSRGAPDSRLIGGEIREVVVEVRNEVVESGVLARHVAAVVGVVGSVTAGIGVLIFNGKIDRLTGRVDALESTMQIVLTLIAGRGRGRCCPTLLQELTLRSCPCCRRLYLPLRSRCTGPSRSPAPRD